ncbi:hypothetical protein B0J12DRAFT_690277 [Macrophomina phaseolina]|uniref:Uncharacterized protein n=1 Tax=Macrophomina phaseolina TaxID=35725 RepID=A0ABQ8FRM6_9PEZI|nr:hypothetical protein B0J12DRAFT_690277 [Macrophomina phaseolina]
MSTPIPLILCGASREVAAKVKANLFPEYNVVYAGYDLPATAREVPQILLGNPPATASLHTDVGSNDFTVPPRAIIIGAPYSDEDFQTLYQGCVEAFGSEANLPVPFFRVDKSLSAKLVAEGKSPKIGTPEYPQAIVNRMKEKLREAGIGSGLIEQSDSKGKILFF